MKMKPLITGVLLATPILTHAYAWKDIHSCDSNGATPRVIKLIETGGSTPWADQTPDPEAIDLLRHNHKFFDTPHLGPNAHGKLDVSLSSTVGNFGSFGRDRDKRFDETKIEVPEPSSLALLAAGLFGIVAMRRKKA